MATPMDRAVLAEICQLLGYDPDDVETIDITPDRVYVRTVHHVKPKPIDLSGWPDDPF